MKREIILRLQAFLRESKDKDMVAVLVVFQHFSVELGMAKDLSISFIGKNYVKANY